MDKKLRKNILEAIRGNGYALEFNELKQVLINAYGHERIVEGHLDIFSSRVQSYLRTLEEAGLIIVTHGQRVPWNTPTTFYSLTDRGYAELGPWHKKFWNFLNDDFAKLASLISLLLSIFATAVSLYK